MNKRKEMRKKRRADFLKSLCFLMPSLLGVGVFFITQNPADVPDSVLSQLGNKIEHGLHAYTPAEQKVVKAAADSFGAITERIERQGLLTWDQLYAALHDGLTLSDMRLLLE